MARNSARSWDELSTRAWQEVFKRCDAAWYRLGGSFNGEERLPRSQERGSFFFKPENLSTLVTVVRERLPLQVQENVGRAERICKHEFDLLGYGQLKFGAEIDWHLDLVHGKRAQARPWFQIRYLDFEEVGDCKIIWELNRLQHLITLAKAFLFTGDQRFADEVFAEWYHWWRENPYPIGINWASSLEVAFRSLSWLWVYSLLEGCPSAPKCFREDFLRALAISGRHIERYRSTYFSPSS